MIEVGKVTAQSCFWGLACPAGDDSVPSQGSPLRCLCSSDLLSLSHTVWTAGRPINEDCASNGAAPWASVGCFQSSLLDQCGSRWLYCVLTMAPLQGLCSVLLSSWGGHRQPCSTGSRLRGGPCWHLIQVGGGGGGSQEGHCMQVSHLLSSHLLLAVTHWMDSGVASFSRVSTQGVRSSSAEAQKSSWV